MNINLQIRYSTKGHSWLCFRHATLLAMKGQDIKTEVDDFDSEYWMGSTVCQFCVQEVKDSTIGKRYKVLDKEDYEDEITRIVKEKQK